MRIVAQWQEQSEDIVYDYRKLYGVKSHLQGHEIARAIFGTFEAAGRYVIHSTYNGDADWGYDDSYSVSEYLDDLNWLREGKADLI